MKFVLTVHQFFPEFFSGTEVLTFSVAKELLRRGHQVFVLTGFPARKHVPDAARFDEYEFEGIHVFRFHHAFVPMGGQSVVTELEYNNRLAAGYFAHVVKKIDPDIVHFFHLGRLGASLIDVTTASNTPSYYTPTDFWSICPTSQLLLQDGRNCAGPTKNSGNCVKHVAALTRGPRIASVARRVPDAIADMVVRSAAGCSLLSTHQLSREIAAMGQRKHFNVSRLNALHGIVSPSRLMTDVLVSNGVDIRLITQSAYGIDIESDSEGRQGRLESEVVTFGFIGTLAPHKGCHVLIDAFMRIANSQCRLKIYGDPTHFPEYVADLKRRANDSPSIEFCGTFPNSKITEVLAGIDALVVPSLWHENTPLVVYSALASKCPVVASNHAGISEVVHDDSNGLLFAAGDIESLRCSLARLIDEPALLPRLSANCGRPKSTGEYVDELLDLYERTRGNSRTRREISNRQLIAPSDGKGQGGYMSGWAVAGLTTPSQIRVRRLGRLVSQTTQFLPRPDVRDALRKGGARVNTASFGFVLHLDGFASRDEIQIEIEARGGRVVTLPLDRVACGSSIHLSDGDYIGLDEEHVESMQTQSRTQP
jgi:glycosyltransferase involved in cell wall biosynthesis